MAAPNLNLTRLFPARALARAVGALAVLVSVAVVPLPGPAVAASVHPVGDAQATVETPPVLSPGDAADDPAIWSHPTDPAASVVIGNDKGGALEVYDLSGALIQRIAEGFFGNVDVRKDFVTGTGTSDLVVTYRLGVRVYRIDPSTRQLSNITDSPSGSIAAPFSGEGLCLYRSPTSGSVYAFANARSGEMAQFLLTDSDGDGLVEGTLVREWEVGSEVEGCVADDLTGDLYLSEEAVGIWKYDAEPSAPTTPDARVLVDGTKENGGRIDADAEGLAIVEQPGGSGYLIVSSQAASNTLNSYVVYERQGSNEFVRSFKVVGGAATDGCARTDGIAALAENLGPAFPHGLFVCQDNTNTLPGTSGYQNFKFVPLERVVGLASVPPPAESPISFLGQASSNVNAKSHVVTVPATVAAGDGLLLFFASNTVATVPNPTGVTGWLPITRITGPSSVTRVWRKVAGAGDAGTAVRITGLAYSKANMVVVAYRGTDALDPVASFVRAAGKVGATAHTTHSAPVDPAGSWAVSYWTHKDPTTNALTPPGGVTVRASGTQSGSGRVTGLLADSGASVPTGSYGGLTASASAPASNASVWTIILAPAA